MAPLGTVIGLPGRGEQSYDNVSWRGSLDHKWATGVMTYLSANRSFKSGGYNLGTPATAVGTAYPPYLPERLTAYELGLKTELFDRRLRLNVAAYHYDYENIQVESSTAGLSLTYNGPSAHFNGADADFNAQVAKGFNLSGGLNPSDPADGSFILDATGKRAIYAPLWSGTLAAQYSFFTTVGSVALNASMKYNDRVYTAVDNRLSIPSYVVENDTATWTHPNGNFSVSLWVLNAFGKVYFNNLLETGTGDWATYAPPRTFGFTLTSRF